MSRYKNIEVFTDEEPEEVIPVEVEEDSLLHA
jgi:hypothetical protein